MKDLNFKELIAYAEAFVSFVFPKLEGINEIILFGSVARKEADKNSDIDLFFNIENEKDSNSVKQTIEKELIKFYKSKIAETFSLRGIKNSFNINAGKLENWKLKRSIISDGICLYSKYKEIPENMKSASFFYFSPIKNIAKRNRIIRTLFGRNEGNYSTEGIVKELNGNKISSSSFIIPLENSNKIINILNKEKIDYKFFEFWTDQIV